MPTMRKSANTNTRQMIRSATLGTITEYQSPRSTAVKTHRHVFSWIRNVSVIHNIRTSLWYPINWVFSGFRYKGLQLQQNCQLHPLACEAHSQITSTVLVFLQLAYLSQVNQSIKYTYLQRIYNVSNMLKVLPVVDIYKINMFSTGV